MAKPTVQFLTQHVWPREWGEECLVIHTERFTGKLLKMKKGSRGGLQFHQKKDEADYILEGEMLLEYDDGTGKILSKKLVKGDSVYMPPGAVHRETALTDCVIFEISNPVFNDRVRMEETYGEKIEGGMPSTKVEDVKEGGPEVLDALLNNPQYQAKK